MMFVSHGYLDIEIFPATAERTICPKMTRPSNSLMSSLHWGYLWVRAGLWLTMQSWTTSTASGQLRTRPARSEKGWIGGTLLKFQISRLNTVIEVITGHCIKATNARCIGLGNHENNFCKSCGNEEEDEATLHILCICPALDKKGKRYLSRHLGILHGGSRWTVMRGYWQSALLHRKLRMVLGIGENVKLWHHYGPCMRPKCVRLWLLRGDSHFYLSTPTRLTLFHLNLNIEAH